MSQKVTVAAARDVIEAARRHAEKIGVPMNIAVVDAGAQPRRLRPDGRGLARQHRHRHQDKAFTARAFDMTTKELAKLEPAGRTPAFGITGEQRRAGW